MSPAGPNPHDQVHARPRSRFRGRGRAGRLAMIGLACGGGAVLAAAFFGDRQVIYNGSPSLPSGLYVRVSGASIRAGVVVDFPIPSAARSYVQQRAGRVGDWYILKPVAAVAGDHVDTTGDRRPAADQR